MRKLNTTDTVPERQKNLRVAAYPDTTIQYMLGDYCQDENLDMAKALKRIIRTQLGLKIQDDSEDTQVNQAIAHLEELVNRYEKLLEEK